MPARKPNPDAIRHVVSGLQKPDRIDRYLRHTFPHWGRKETGRLITAGKVELNGRTVHLGSWQVHNGDSLEIDTPPAPLPVGFTTFDTAWIVADDGTIIALNKPAGLLTEPTRWGEGINLLDLARAHFGANLWMPHRLDRDTSGVVLLARDDETGRWLDTQFRERTVQKHYVAVVHAPNKLAAEGEIRAPLFVDPQRPDRVMVVRSGGKWAKTLYKTDAPQGNKQLVHLWPETGRTHQLRVHLAHMGAPILGDRIYGNAASAPRLMLHAAEITLPRHHEGEPTLYSAPIPPEFETT
jgi:23S rRNA pseudouridine1911/1915/1917 synthase